MRRFIGPVQYQWPSSEEIVHSEPPMKVQGLADPAVTIQLSPKPVPYTSIFTLPVVLLKLLDRTRQNKSSRELYHALSPLEHDLTGPDTPHGGRSTSPRLKSAPVTSDITLQYGRAALPPPLPCSQECPTKPSLKQCEARKPPFCILTAMSRECR